MKLQCVDCSKLYPPTLIYSCEECDGILEAVFHEDNQKLTNLQPNLLTSMWKYHTKLPIESSENIVSLYEGLTTLHKGVRIHNDLNGFNGNVYFKNETLNPTGSFKDRLVSVAISKAKELGYSKVVCASSGNAGASAAAYAAKAGMEAIIIAPKTTPKEKLTQISSYGPKVILVEGDYSNSYNLAEKLSKDFGYVNLTTTFINPYGTDALKTVAYELDEQLNGELPDYILIPVGSGPLLKGLYQGYMEILNRVNVVNGKIPKLIAVQADGCAPIVKAYELGLEKVNAWGKPETIASGISDPLKGYEKDGTYTLQLVRQSNGLAISVNDIEIKEAMKSLANNEGIFAEPTGASTFAAMKKLIEKRLIDADSNVVCMVTGHGFKDMKVYFEMIEAFNYLDNPNDYDSICKVIFAEEISRSK